MKFSRTTLFKRSYQKLEDRDRRRIDRALRLLAEQPFYPYHGGLSVHKLEGVRGTAIQVGASPPQVWEMHATDELLVTFQYGEEEILFRNCGHHNDVLRSP